MTESENWFEKLMASMPPAARRNHDRHRRVMRIQFRMVELIRWPRWPILKVVWTFWATLFDEGIVQTCKPRWGALTFSYLNDGMKPTVWHTLRQITHPHDDPYTGIYVRGAPKSLAQAEEWEAKWAKQREQEVK